MTAIFNGRMKYLFLAPLAVLIIFAILTQTAIVRLNDELLADKKNTAQAEIDQLASITGILNEYDRNLSKDGYINVLISQIAKINGSQIEIAALYDQNLKLVSYDSAATVFQSFDPTQSSQFTDDVSKYQSGWVDLSYSNQNSQQTPVSVYYRWAPVSPFGSANYLLTIGVSAESLTVKSAGWLTTGMIIQLAVTFLMNMAFVLLLCYLGEIYKSRSGLKWRQG